MRFAEEVLLLLLNEETGYFVPIPEWKLSCALAGSVLIDLSLEDRIDSDLRTLTLLDATPTGDALLDPVLEDLAMCKQVHPPQYWVERVARRSDEISAVALKRLVRVGVLNADAGGFWSLSKKVAHSRRYPVIDGRTGVEIKSRIMRLLFSDEIPDPRDCAIVSLMNSCGGMRVMLDPDEYDLAETRIELLSGMDLIGRAIGEAVRSSYHPPGSKHSVRLRPIPVVGLFGMLKSRALRSGNIPRFMAEKRRELGPVFQINAGGRRLTVLAGREMNQWVRRRGRHHLRTRDYLEGFQQEWGTARSIASMDGADHFRMRRAVQAGNSRAVIEDRLDELLELARRTFADWGVGNVVCTETACQRLIGEQVAKLSVSIEPSSDVLDDLLAFEYRALLVHVMDILPRFTLRTPAMKRAHARVLDLYAQIHATHTPAQREGKRRDLVDDLMALHQSDPQFLPETDLGFAFIAPIIAGHYLGSATAFAIYEMFMNPDLKDRIAAEADALFENGDPVAADLDPSSIDVTHRFVMETLRLYPVVPVHMRTAMNSFEIDGMEIPAGSAIMIAFTAVHYDKEYFKSPLVFDIERFAPPRNEHRRTGAYVPFGIGTHVCGGARWSELQLAMNVLLIARHLELEMVPANYKLKISPLPKLSPNKKFRFRVVRHRHPVE